MKNVTTLISSLPQMVPPTRVWTNLATHYIPSTCLLNMYYNLRIGLPLGAEAVQDIYTRIPPEGGTMYLYSNW